MDNGWQQHIGVCLLSCRRSDPVAGQPVMLQTDQEGQQQELALCTTRKGGAMLMVSPKTGMAKRATYMLH